MYISKDLIRRTIVVAVAMAIYFAFLSALAQAAITAPKCIEAGQLAVAHSDEPATWTVFPVKYQTDIYIADGGLTCIFASPVKGEITLMAATVEDGKAVISQHTLYNGLPNPEGDETTPVPEPPKPAPEPEKTPMEKAIDSAKNYPEKDVETLAETFDAVVSGIDRGTISTPVAARETFRALWAAKAIEIDPEAITRDAPLITELSSVVDNSSITTVKKDYTTISSGLKEVVLAKAPSLESEEVVEVIPEQKIEPKPELLEVPNSKPAPESKPEKKEAPPETPKQQNGNCPNGNCPQQTSGRMFYWGR